MLKKLLPLLLALPFTASAQTVLSAGAIELSINFVAAHVGGATNPWLLGVRQNDVLVEIAGSISGSVGTERVTLFANEQTRITVPYDPRFAPLGTPGASAWLLPDAPSNHVLAPGITTESRATQPGWRGEGVPADFLAAGVPAGAFVSNRITLALESFSGPGDFSLYRLSGFGDPIWYFRTDDGLTSADARTFNSQSHSDLNWAFTAPGDYYLGFRASGTLLGGAATSSDVTTFHFQVVPEPSSAALLLSALALAGRRWGRQGAATFLSLTLSAPEAHHLRTSGRSNGAREEALSGSRPPLPPPSRDWCASDAHAFGDRNVAAPCACTRPPPHRFSSHPPHP